MKPLYFRVVPTCPAGFTLKGTAPDVFCYKWSNIRVHHATAVTVSTNTNKIESNC